MSSTLKFLQAYQNAALHSTTTLRCHSHYSQTQDLSNLAPEQAIQLFPYEIFPMELSPDLLETLAKNQSHLLTRYASDYSASHEGPGIGIFLLLEKQVRDAPRIKVKAKARLVRRILGNLEERAKVSPVKGEQAKAQIDGPPMFPRPMQNALGTKPTPAR